MKMVLFIIAWAAGTFGLTVFIGKILKHCGRNVPSPGDDKQDGGAEKGTDKAIHIDSYIDSYKD